MSLKDCRHVHHSAAHVFQSFGAAGRLCHARVCVTCMYCSFDRGKPGGCRSDTCSLLTNFPILCIDPQYIVMGQFLPLEPSSCQPRFTVALN